jgi:methyl-accepting chemotaxis protein
MFILGMIISNSVSKEITQLAKSRNLEVAKGLQSQFNQHLIGIENTIRLANSEDELNDNDISMMEERFKKIKKNNSDFLLVYLGIKDGQTISHPKVDFTNFDPRTRPWHQKAKAEDKLIWTNIYLDAITKKPVITVAIPHYDRAGNFIGVLAVDLSLVIE